jgi:hypothetical protein
VGSRVPTVQFTANVRGAAQTCPQADLAVSRWPIRFNNHRTMSRREARHGGGRRVARYSFADTTVIFLGLLVSIAAIVTLCRLLFTLAVFARFCRKPIAYRSSGICRKNFLKCENVEKFSPLWTYKSHDGRNLNHFSYTTHPKLMLSPHSGCRREIIFYAKKFATEPSNYVDDPTTRLPLTS